jgi:hypothetical protein
MISIPSSGNAHIRRVSKSYADDDGVAIPTLWRSGFYDLGLPGQEKTLRETVLWGTGTPSLVISEDFGAADTATAVALGSNVSPFTVAQGRRRIAKRGTYFSHTLTNAQAASAGGWRVGGLTHYLREAADPGRHTAD